MSCSPHAHRYTREEQQLRYAFLQTGEVFILATGGIVNFGLEQLHRARGLAGWRWMFLVQGVCAMFIGLMTYWWIVDFPENSHKSFHFLTAEEQRLAVHRIEKDRGDVQAVPFAWKEVFRHANDPKVYGFAIMLFLLNIVWVLQAALWNLLMASLGFYRPFIFPANHSTKWYGILDEQSDTASSPALLLRDHPRYYVIFCR